MVYGAQNFYYMYYERPNRKTVKAQATVAKVDTTAAKSAQSNKAPAFATNNVAVC
ncbi:hypothetical protein JYB87_15805 [Shewanella avicenniae]|uniref:Uncharacterized protein n=1 Tax=Shewanella avicenniae TaxID=2814294 RepID=A0ABX7QR54_9GAMM|nr:hypothetical protein [Shewanella avicenniae]QSX33171.1 hypothetical protein JYB87_15805 [Shewanella avicenniae]